MKICIPTMGKNGMDERVGDHFGRVPTYTLVDTETGEIKVVDNTSEHMGGQGYPPEIIAGTGADTLLCAGLGRRAIVMLQEYGIRVYIGASGTVKEAIAMLDANQLQLATQDNACAQHAFHDHH